MAITSLNPYLNYNGTAADAIKLYERALGARVETLSRFDEVPGMPVPPEQASRVMHAALRIGAGTLMISDTPPGMPAARESNTHVALHCDDAAEMEQMFQALAAGGTVMMPMQDTFWGARFGMLTDAFGIRWMFNCELKKGWAAP
jgi:PhnB protein